MTDKVEDKVTELKFEMTREEVTRAKVIDIALAFDNGQIMKLLTKRGKAIAKLDFEKVRVLDEQISLEAKNWDKNTRPCDAFITFNLEEDFNAAMKLEKVFT